MCEKKTTPSCVYCGVTEDLVADEHLEEVWYCKPCFGRRDAHQEIIDHGFDDEEPTHD
jgi:hypothetical protein